jgi:hypothetical protein
VEAISFSKISITNEGVLSVGDDDILQACLSELLVI